MLPLRSLSAGSGLKLRFSVDPEGPSGPSFLWRLYAGVYLSTRTGRRMSRFIFSLILFLFSSASFAFSCSQQTYGPYDSFGSAYNACLAGTGGSCATGAGGPNGFSGVGSWRNSVGNWQLNYRSCEELQAIYGGTEDSVTSALYLYSSQCPVGTSPDASGYCGCDDSSQYYDIASGSCESPPADDDFDDETGETDDSPNTGEGGGDGNDSGGDPSDPDGDGNSDGSECNFSPEGCAPGDRPDDPPDLADLDAPDNSLPPPPDAVTTDESTSTDHTTGDSTSTTTQKWTETDGCVVTQTTTTTNRADGSSGKSISTNRRCPQGGSTTTTTGYETDDQGNTSLTGETVQKEQEPEGSVSGGGDCVTPPRCSGDAIQCGILMQQWLTRCDKNDEYSDSDCSSQPSCDGDVLLCAGLINTWQNRCSQQTAAADAQGFFEERGFKTAEDYASEGGVFGNPEETDLSGVADGVFSSRSSVAGSCPSAFSFTAPNFGTFELSLEPFCTLADEIYWLVLLSAYMTAAFIIFRAVTN